VQYYQETKMNYVTTAIVGNTNMNVG